MPMPPPRPSTEGRRDRQSVHETQQIVRALKEHGPLPPEDLSRLVGAPYWEAHRFERALSMGVADGILVLDKDGQVHAV